MKLLVFDSKQRLGNAQIMLLATFNKIKSLGGYCMNKKPDVTNDDVT